MNMYVMDINAIVVVTRSIIKMKQVTILREVLNPEVSNISEILEEYQEVKSLMKELKVREDLYKKALEEKLDKENAFEDEKYIAEIKEITREVKDSKWVDSYFVVNNIEVPVNKSSYYKINVKRKMLK